MYVCMEKTSTAEEGEDGMNNTEQRMKHAEDPKSGRRHCINQRRELRVLALDLI